MKTIVVTGGGGFIGSNLVAALLARGTHHVVICDTFGSSEKWRNLSRWPVSEIIEPQFMFAWLEKNQEDIEMVYHLGSVSSTVEKNIDLILEHNFTLSLVLLRWCTQRSVRLVYASSSATYGDGSSGFDDNIELSYMSTLKPMSGYGWSKHLFDTHVARAVANSAPMPPQWVGLKFFNVYGPNEYHKEDQRSVIAKIAPQALQGAAVRLFRSYNKLYADGEQKRDVLYVKDCVKVLLWFLEHGNVSGLFNLGTGKAASFNEMAQAIYAAIGKNANIHYMDMPDSLVANYQYYTEANISRLRAAGCDVPFTSVQDGIRDFVQNYLQKPDPYL